MAERWRGPRKFFVLCETEIRERRGPRMKLGKELRTKEGRRRDSGCADWVVG